MAAQPKPVTVATPELARHSAICPRANSQGPDYSNQHSVIVNITANAAKHRQSLVLPRPLIELLAYETLERCHDLVRVSARASTRLI